VHILQLFFQLRFSLLLFEVLPVGFGLRFSTSATFGTSAEYYHQGFPQGAWFVNVYYMDIQEFEVPPFTPTFRLCKTAEIPF
jgi:hypothetical protein